MGTVDTTPYIAEGLLQVINEVRGIRGEEPIDSGEFSEELPRVRRAETLLLERCAACYETLSQIHNLTRGNGLKVSSEVYEQAHKLMDEHLRRRRDFEEAVLRKGSFLNGDEMGELGRAYMGRCYGGMRDQKGLLFLCPNTILTSYVNTLKVKPEEGAPQDI